MNHEEHSSEERLEELAEDIDFSVPDSENIELRPELGTDTVTVRLDSDTKFVLVDVPQVPLANANDTEVVGEVCDFEYRLASGGMGVIYSATQKELQRAVAVKVLREDKINEPTIVDGFLVEAKVAAELEHPNIIPVHSLGRTENEMPALVMKKVSGVSWGDILREKKEKGFKHEIDAESWRIFRSVCHAISFAHSKGILHLDLKPNNILIGTFGEVLVVDWGIARGFGDFPRHAEINLPHARELQCICGTPSYMAPEMVYADGEKMGPWTDVYQLGSILYRILEGTTANATNSKSIRDTLRNALREGNLTFSQEIPDGLKEICSKALAQDIADRYQNIEELIEAVDRFLEHKESTFLTEGAIEELSDINLESRGLSKMRTEEGPKLYSGYASVIGTLENALSLWPENKEASLILADAKLAYADLAKDCGDFRLAKMTLEGMAGKETEALREEIKLAEEQMFTSQKVEEFLRVFRLAFLVSITAFVCGVLALGWLFYTSKKDVETEAHGNLTQAGIKTLSVVASDSADRIATNLDYVHTQLDAFAFQVQTRLNEMRSGKRKGFPNSFVKQHTAILEESRSPMLYGGGTLFLPLAAKTKENIASLSTIKAVQPALENLTGESNSIVLLTFVAFETGLYFVYPASNTKVKLSQDYDPRIRPWYRDGKLVAGINKTPPYIGASTQKAVISLTRRILDKGGNVLGVAAVDCWLNDVINLPPIPIEWRSEAEIQIIQLENTSAEEATFKVTASRTYEKEISEGNFSMTTYDISLNELDFKRTPEIDTMVANLGEFKSGVLSPAGAGDAHYRAYAPIGESGDFLLIKIPSEAVTRQADGFIQILDSRTRSALIRLFLLAPTVILVIFLARRTSLNWFSR